MSTRVSLRSLVGMMVLSLLATVFVGFVAAPQAAALPDYPPPLEQACKIDGDLPEELQRGQVVTISVEVSAQTVGDYSSVVCNLESQYDGAPVARAFPPLNFEFDGEGKYAAKTRVAVDAKQRVYRMRSTFTPKEDAPKRTVVDGYTLIDGFVAHPKAESFAVKNAKVAGADVVNLDVDLDSLYDYGKEGPGCAPDECLFGDQNLAVAYAIFDDAGTRVGGSKTSGEAVDTPVDLPLGEGPLNFGYLGKNLDVAFDSGKLAAGEYTLRIWVYNKDADGGLVGEFSEPADATFTLVSHTLKVTDGSGSGDYLANEVVGIEAVEKVGMVFDHWKAVSGKPTIADVSKAKTTLTMPDNDAEVMAVYVPAKYVLTVENGGIDGSYIFGQLVTLRADDPPAGKVFDKWVVVSGSPSIKDVKASPTTLTMPAEDVTVKATYKDAPVKPKSGKKVLAATGSTTTQLMLAAAGLLGMGILFSLSVVARRRG